MREGAATPATMGHPLPVPGRLFDALAVLRVRRLLARHRFEDDLKGVEPYMGNLWRGQLGAWWHAHAPGTFAAFMNESGGGRHWALRAPWADADYVPAGAVLETRVTLVGPALAHEAAVIDALEGGGLRGLGPRHGPVGSRTPARLVDLHVETMRLSSGGETGTPSLLDILESAVADPPGAEPDLLRVDLSTPLRIKLDGEVFAGVPSAEQLLRRTLGRLVQLLPQVEASAAPVDTDGRRRLFDPDQHAAWVAAARACHCESRDMQAWRWPRQSRRTGAVMPLEGITGRLLFRGPRPVLLPWFRAADWLQIGSRTTFGFGALSVG